ncbi:MAG TPA: ATP-dependent DNA helicase RecQ [Gemmatimonadaceae bacterium]|nr:ATP-dependent DNA helicase RecQ [Gemmatimonadaceae bacterium]
MLNDVATEELLEKARAMLRQSFGYPGFRPGQERAITSILSGRDTLVVLPTGGGKSLCYQVPALILPGLTVVVSPLISLMKDQVDALSARGLPAAFINSTLTSSQVSDRLSKASRGEIKMLYVAPERFDAGSTAERLKAMGVSLLAVDEAHCISEWGHDFRPSYLRMRAVRDRLGAPPTMALTATATPEVRKDIAAQLALRNPTIIVTGFDRTNLHYHVLPTRTDQEKDDMLVQTLRDTEGLAVVYAATRRNVERVSGVLERARISSTAYHAGLDDAHRHEVQDSFMQERVRAIVATNAFGMGIDKPNVRLVVHHAMPGTLEAYYQEAGRAGRDGQHSECVLLHAFPDRFMHEFFIKGAYPERSLVEAVYVAMQRVVDGSGMMDMSSDDIARLVPGKVAGRDVDAALRIMLKADAVRRELESGSSVMVRLLATPERIKRELPESHNPELGLLRALWRAVGARLHDGAVVSLDGLPPGFSGASTAIPLLTSLQSRQFLTWERIGGGTRLTNPKAPLSAFPVEWAAIDRRRRADLAKLDAVQKYAYTTGCRRAFVLRYFGDESSRGTCGGCDNCLGLHAGKERQKPAPTRARREKAAPVAGGRAPGAVGERAESGARMEVVLEGADARLFASLKALRSSIAREEQVPAYVVFTDRTLAELAARKPRTTAGLLEVHGVGPARLDKYGERFLAAIRGADETEAA